MTERRRRTKILATLGPRPIRRACSNACSKPASTWSGSISRTEIRRRRKRAPASCAGRRQLGREVGILADLPGTEDPGRALRRGQVALKAGERFDLVARADAARRRTPGGE